MDVLYVERIPLLYTAEIDHRIFLNVLLHFFDQDQIIQHRLEEMFKQAISYISPVDFDDINYTNAVFTKAGKLSLFDRDSKRAETGVLSFLRLFFAYRVVSEQDVETLLKVYFEQQPDTLLLAIKALYQDPSSYDAILQNDHTKISEMYKFLRQKENDSSANVSLASIVGAFKQGHARAVDFYIRQHLSQHQKSHHVWCVLRTPKRGRLGCSP